MKNSVLLVFLMLFLNSCNVLQNIFAFPVDRPHGLLNKYVLKENRDTIQIKTDYFVENNSKITRYNKGFGVYDNGEYRKYQMMCDNDTLTFHIVFSGNDSIARIGVQFFEMRNVYFATTDYSETEKAIKKHKELYNTCQACYENNFLNPLKKYLNEDK